MLKTKTHKKVLILEDEPDAGLLLSGILRSYNYTPHLVTTIAEARLELQKPNDYYNLLFFDYNLPDGKSIELIKDSSLNSHVPTIICSAYLSSDNKVEMKKFGVLDCLNKPINNEEIRNVLTKHNLI